MASSVGALFGAGRAKTPRQLNSVVVSLKTGTTIRGVLIDRALDGLVLRAASQADEDQNHRIRWTPLAGDVVLPMENVDYYQMGVEPAVTVEG